MDGADVVLLAVKPQHMSVVLDEMRDVVPPSAMVISIAAGCQISMFTEKLPTQSIVRSMPNTPAMIGQGMTVWTSVGCSDEQIAAAKSLLQCCGDEVYVQEEHYLDMATAIVGSGPACEPGPHPREASATRRHAQTASACVCVTQTSTCSSSR